MATADDAAAVYAKIDSLDMSPSLKESMRMVHDHFKGNRFGLPEYDLKGTKMWKVISLWAAFFTVFYYLFKGMWRKALSLLGLSVGMACVLVGAEAVLGRPIHQIFYHIPSAMVAAICLMSAYRDIYRRRVLGQTFWW